MVSASASSAARLCALACRQTPRLQTAPRLQRVARSYPVARRPFTTTRSRWEGEPPRKGEEPAAQAEKPGPSAPGEGAGAEAASPEKTATGAAGAKGTARDPFMGPTGDNIELWNAEILDVTAKNHGYGTFDQFVDGELEKGLMTPRAEREFERQVEQLEEVKPDKKSWWYDEDDPEMDCEEVEDFDEDDMTEMAHAKLEEVKEMRQYSRRAVYELPLLSKLAKPFEPPTDKQVLRWRYTSYMGESHPAEKKVVVQFAPDDLGLTATQTSKLKKLVGTRYNPETELVKMSFEGYEHVAQNKRYLADLVKRLITEAKDPKDTFEDIPLDTRHHRVQAKPRFPKEWLMTEERQRFLDDYRKQAKLAELERAESGQLVDGKEAIDGYLAGRMREEQKKQEQMMEEQLVAAPTRSSARSSARARNA